MNNFLISDFLSMPPGEDISRALRLGLLLGVAVVFALCVAL